MSSESQTYDLAVIGGGSAGYAAARTAAAAGLRTAVIDGGKELGGLCILRGCMPTKAFLHSAEALHHARHAGIHGIQVPQAWADFQQVVARKDQLIKEFADYRAGQLHSGRFALIRAFARFTSSSQVELSNGETLSARSFIITTGSVVAPNSIPGLGEAGFITSDEALALKALPKSLIVLGGGAVAVEFAQFFSRMGSAVTVVQRSAHLLRDFDSDAAVVLRNVFEREGIQVHSDTQLISARAEEGQKVVRFAHQGKEVEIRAEEIFFGLGRVPATGQLNLAAAGVETENGRILINSRMETSAPNIYAAGDCTGLHEIVHIAIQQGEIAAHNAAHPESRKTIDYRLMTSVVFTEPQIAAVGLTEAQAQKAGIPYRAASYPFNDHGKSLIMDAKDGFVKLLADPKTGEILGGSVAGPVGGELIHEIIVAMAKRMTARELAAVPHYHPTLAEIWTYPAEELADQIPA